MFNKLISQIIPVLPKQLVWIFSKRYIAGATLEDAIKVTVDLNNKGIKVTLDILGENIKYLNEANSYKEQYINTIKITQKLNLDCSYSLKPSMFGLMLDTQRCYELIKEVAEVVVKGDKQIILDMEGSDCTDSEIKLFKDLYMEYPGNVGFVLQAYLKRTATDIESLRKVSFNGYSINLRLCKGIYIEPETISFKSKEEVRSNYIKNMRSIMKGGFYGAFATHDIKLVNSIYNEIKGQNLDKNKFEFQMLYGVKPELRQKIVNDGYTMRVYVPFGKDWFGYSTRRLKENPKVVGHIIRSLFVRG